MTKKPSILDQINVKEGSDILAPFSLAQVTMKDDFAWRFKMKIHSVLPKSFYQYDILLFLNETPFLERIKTYEEKVKESKRQGKMFDDEKLSLLEQELENVKSQYDLMKQQCDRIEFDAFVEEIKYKGVDTVVVLRIPDTVINSINKNKIFFPHFVIRLAPKK